MRLSKIAEYLNIKYTDGDIEISSLNTLQDASQRELSFFQNEKYLNELKNTKAGAVIIDSKYSEYIPQNTKAIYTNQAYLNLARVTKLFKEDIPKKVGEEPKIGQNCDIDNSVNFGKNVIIENNVTIMAGAYIGDDVTIKESSFIYPNVTIYPKTKIGKDVIIQANSVIGSDGFGFAHTLDGRHVKIYHLGSVTIEDEVEIGSNVSIDKGVFGETLIQKGTKIDNLVQIAHNCQIGENSLLVAQSGFAGSSKLGRNVVMGAQSGSAGHLEIGDFTTVAARGGVTKSLKGSSTYAGFPAVEHKKWLKKEATISKLSKNKSR
jgi:UDP-3-O-[3-hydroxymyristoyl] glucosamine N-acyltransferase